MPDVEPRSIAFENSDYRLKSITLDDLTVRTEFFHFPHPKKINLAYTISEADQFPNLRITSLKVELANDDEEVVATVECAFKVDFALEGDEHSEAFLENLNLVATRMSYPYHRQLVSDIVSRMGLRPTFLPAVPDDLWEQKDLDEENGARDTGGSSVDANEELS